MTGRVLESSPRSCGLASVVCQFPIGFQFRKWPRVQVVLARKPSVTEGTFLLELNPGRSMTDVTAPHLSTPLLVVSSARRTHVDKPWP